MYLFICWTCICCSLRQGLRLGSRIRGHDIQMQPIDLAFNPYSWDGDDSMDGIFRKKKKLCQYCRKNHHHPFWLENYKMQRIDVWKCRWKRELEHYNDVRCTMEFCSTISLRHSKRDNDDDEEEDDFLMIMMVMMDIRKWNRWKNERKSEILEMKSLFLGQSSISYRHSRTSGCVGVGAD